MAERARSQHVSGILSKKITAQNGKQIGGRSFSVALCHLFNELLRFIFTKNPKAAAVKNMIRL